MNQWKSMDTRINGKQRDHCIEPTNQLNQLNQMKSMEITGKGCTPCQVVLRRDEQPGCSTTSREQQHQTLDSQHSSTMSSRTWDTQSCWVSETGKCCKPLWSNDETPRSSSCAGTSADQAQTLLDHKETVRLEQKQDALRYLELC